MDGCLLPFGFLKLLRYRRKIDCLRTIVMGVVEKFRHRGIDNCFYYETYKRGMAKGFWRGEMSWILENNTAMNRVLNKLGYILYKKYRLYDYRLLT